MKFDVQMLFILVGIGLASRKLDWKGWFVIGALILIWMAYNLARPV